MPPVELHYAFRWDCDACGVENFFRAVEGELSEPALAADGGQSVTVGVIPGATADEHSPPDRLDAGTLILTVLLAPRRVTCRSCGKTFGRVLPSPDG